MKIFSAIKEILNGRRGHRETIRMTDFDREKYAAVSDLYDELAEKLTPEQMSLHEKFEDTLLAAHCEECDGYYLEGFKLGLLIGIECMD